MDGIRGAAEFAFSRLHPSCQYAQTERGGIRVANNHFITHPFTKNSAIVLNMGKYLTQGLGGTEFTVLTVPPSF